MTEQILGNYKVIKKIGAGGMAKVYLAVHKDIPNLRVILKIVSDERLAERFKQEADKLALLDGHASICRIKHFFNEGEDLVIAMEYIDGVTLEQKLRQESRLQLDEAVRVVCDLLDVLAFAHERGIYHRDIKPSNIMIDKQGTVKIIDFGIAKAETDPSLTLAGTACGTPAYMAPEQFTPNEKTNYALVDCYAAGVTLYYLVTGELPFMGDNEFAIRDAKLFNDPQKPRELNPKIPRDLEEVILKSIHKDPDQRFQSVREMQRALSATEVEPSESLDGPTIAFETGTSAVHQQPTTKPTGGKGKLVAGLAVLVILAAVAVYFGTDWLRGGPSTTETNLPAAPELVDPIDGSTVSADGKPTLTWKESVPDGGSYILEYATDSNFAGSKTIAGLTGSSYTFGNILPNGRYFWRLYPISASGVRGDPSGYGSFVLEPEATSPEVPPDMPRHVSTGTLNISVTPPSDIYVDGRKLADDRSSATSSMEAGAVVVRLENPGSVEKTIIDTVRLASGETVNRSYTFTMPRPTQPTGPATGEVRIGSRPRGASIFIDGELQSQKTNYTFYVPEGSHIIRAALVLDGEELERTEQLNIVADSVYRVMFEFD